MYSLVIIKQCQRHDWIFARNTIVMIKAARIFRLMRRRPPSSDANIVGKMSCKQPLEPFRAIDIAAFYVKRPSPSIYFQSTHRAVGGNTGVLSSDIRLYD